MVNISNINDVAETLVENGATYVAVNAQSLVDEPAGFYYYLPDGTSGEEKETIATYLDEEVRNGLYDRQVGAIHIADQPVPAWVYRGVPNDLHLYRREPIYVAEGVAGLDPITMVDGVARVEEIVDTQPPFEPRPSKTVPLDDLVRELAEAGAFSVEVTHEPLVIGGLTVDLRISMVPADGKPVVGPVNSVKVNGNTYPLSTTLTSSGPGGHLNLRTPLYISDNVKGHHPLSVGDGLQNGRELIASADDADTFQDLESPDNGRDNRPEDRE